MGFGEIGRSLYRLCLEDERIEVVAISDIGCPEILHYLLTSTKGKALDVNLEGNFLVSSNGRARMLRGTTPSQVPWDSFDVDFVVDATGKYRNRAEMMEHIDSGAKRVILSFVPNDEIDRIVVMGVNEESIQVTDRLISPGSATTNASAILLKILDGAFGVDYATLTAIHAYTADQPLRDTAGLDFRRSRSAAENIIPNVSPSIRWLPVILPNLAGKIAGTALNVPVPSGSLLDLNTFLHKPNVTIDEVHAEMEKAAKRMPNILLIENDPIVSSDVIGVRQSVVYDKQATMKSSGRILKTMSWFHASVSLAARIKEIILAYDAIDKKGVTK